MLLTRREILEELVKMGYKRLSDLKTYCRNFEVWQELTANRSEE